MLFALAAVLAVQVQHCVARCTGTGEVVENKTSFSSERPPERYQ
jgi:hypothetical protein